MNIANSLPSTSNKFIIPEPTPSIEPIIDPVGIEEDNNIVAPRRSKRQRVEKSFGDDFIIYLIDDTPTTIAEAYASPDTDYWKDAVRSEMHSITANGTWEVCVAMGEKRLSNIYKEMKIILTLSFL